MFNMETTQTLRRKKAPRTRWGDREARVRDILEAAKSLLRERGADGFNLRAIAERAGVSLGVPYWYFESKEEIFVRVYAGCTDELGREIDGLCLRATNPSDLFKDVAGAYRIFYRDYGRHLNTMAFASDAKALAALPREVIARMRAEQTRIVLQVSTRLTELDPKAGAALTADPKRLPFLWIVVSGLADFFLGPRSAALPFDWNEMVGYAAENLLA